MNRFAGAFLVPRESLLEEAGPRRSRIACYEIIRLSGAHATNPLVKFIVYPSLALQSLTTRKPDDAQIEVAIRAMERAIAIDEGTVSPDDEPQVEATADFAEAPMEAEAEGEAPAPS